MLHLMCPGVFNLYLGVTSQSISKKNKKYNSVWIRVFCPPSEWSNKWNFSQDKLLKYMWNHILVRPSDFSDAFIDCQYCWGHCPPLLLSGYNCGRTLALTIKSLLCYFQSPISFGISGSSIGCNILQVVSKPGRLGESRDTRVLQVALQELRRVCRWWGRDC